VKQPIPRTRSTRSADEHGEVPPSISPACLAAWRLDVGGEAFALIELPPAPRLENIDVAPLTAAEREVAALVLCSLSNEEIARRRGASPRTVANQVATVLRKLKVRSRRELFVLAATAAWERP
jgi:DNA-binding CsgD family transcriptional regulator